MINRFYKYRIALIIILIGMIYSCSLINKDYTARKYTKYRRGYVAKEKIILANKQKPTKQQKDTLKKEHTAFRNELNKSSNIGTSNVEKESIDKRQEMLTVQNIPNQLSSLKYFAPVKFVNKEQLMVSSTNNLDKEEYLQILKKKQYSDLDKYNVDLESNKIRLLAARKLRNSTSELNDDVQSDDAILYNTKNDTYYEYLVEGNLSKLDKILFISILVLLPPLALFLFEGKITRHFWIDILLFVMLYVPGLIYALYVMDII